MTLQIRRAADRGHANHGWLDTHHTFSFANYHDPAHMGFRSLRVINEDRVAPGQGFGAHSHRDMEILTYVLEGALEHRDSMGNGSVIRPGDIQRMSAGTGVTHSEYNHSPAEPVHFLQIWIHPDKLGVAPSYQQISIADRERAGRLRLVASPDGADGSLTLHQDARLYVASLEPGDHVEHRLGPGRHAWIHVARGAIHANGQRLDAGDGAAIEVPETVTLVGADDAEVLVFDLA